MIDPVFQNIPKGHIRVVRFDPSDNSFRVLGDYTNHEKALDLVDESKAWLTDSRFPYNAAYNDEGEQVRRSN